MHHKHHLSANLDPSPKICSDLNHPIIQEGNWAISHSFFSLSHYIQASVLLHWKISIICPLFFWFLSSPSWSYEFLQKPPHISSPILILPIHSPQSSQNDAFTVRTRYYFQLKCFPIAFRIKGGLYLGLVSSTWSCLFCRLDLISIIVSLILLQSRQMVLSYSYVPNCF